MEHEQAIVASMIFDVQCLEQGLIECEPDDFANMDCRRIFNAMRILKDTGTPVDLVTLNSMFEPVYISTVMRILDAPYMPSNMAAYIELLKAERKRREFRIGLVECLQLVDDENDSAYQAAQELLDKVNCIGGGRVRSIADVVDEAVLEMGERVAGEPTGFCDLDRIVGGLMRGDLIVVAGRPSMGKSSLAVNIAQNFCERGKTVALFSMEGSEKATIRRMVCAKAKVSIANVRSGDQRAINKALAAKDEMREYKLFICDKGVQTAQSIASECYKIRQKAGLDLAIVDYLGLIKTRERKNGTRQQEIGEITRAMKLLAKDMNCPVILVSQLNRGLETRNNKKPMLADLRESGDIEQDADIILFPFRPWVYDRGRPETEAQLIIAKYRDGATGEVDLYWRGEWFLFESAAMKKDGYMDPRAAGVPREWAGA